MTTSFCSDATELLPVLRDVRPTWFVGVPRTWEKLAAGIQATIDAEPDAGRRGAALAALDVGRTLVDTEQRGLPVDPELLAARDRFRSVHRSILAAIGLDRCRVAVCGSAPVSTDVLALFHGIGLAVSEGWGMTEVMAGTWNGVERIRLGTVGPTMPGVEARLATDGELLVRGGATMVGYHADAEATKQVMSVDGWLRTGDLAHIDEDGYIRIVGRKKDLIVTSGGTKVSPSYIEELLREHPLVGQVCVLGDRRPYLSALIVLDADAAERWALAHGLGAVAPDRLATQADLLAEVQRAVDSANQWLARPQQIKRFTVVAREWSVLGGELTPTLKVRRDAVIQAHAAVIAEMYH